MSRSGAHYAPAAGFLSGTGFPEGVVTADVGTRYIDTDATNGAVEWIKATGSGDTGWVIVSGDTGWRDVTASVLDGWTATSILIRRVNERTFIVGHGFDGSASTSINMFGVPVGFRGTLDRTPALPVQSDLRAAEDNPSTSAFGGGSAQYLRGVQTWVGMDIGGDYLASDPWPSSLPGSAA